MYYRLKVPVERITFQQWLEIFETLRTYGDFSYKILKNDEQPLEDWYGTSILPLMYLSATSPHYNIDDEYVLINLNTKNVVSGDEEYILEKIEKNKEVYISTLLSYLNSGIVFGYLGHEERTKESDKVICEFLDENPDMKEKVNSGFIRNSTGRHFMDNCPSQEELRKFLEEL